jgi:hypothetical protein
MSREEQKFTIGREAGRLERHKKGEEEPNSEKRIHHREGEWMRYWRRKWMTGILNDGT